MNADPKQVKAIFLEAVEKHAPDQWPDYLDQTCAGQLDLRRRVEVLLEAHREAGTDLHRASAENPSPAAFDVSGSVQQGTIIGPYKLLQQIGEGGMGVVWMAEQTRPVQRKVALKIIKAGMDTRQVIARFEAERQALALMDHPNIAKVLDAGTTDAGRPFFVMELVKGVPMTKYCDEHRLTPRQRLDLFLPVCQAIQHAHQKGIIHRDIKPSNVLIAPYDGKPVVKAIDFGVAKATGQRLTDKTLFTEFGAIVGTLEYMSPEQAELNNQDIDTRSDIYSLGVLLYELLTGTTPLDRKHRGNGAILDLLRMIREEEPPRPSTRLAESKETLPSISAQRQTEPAKLTRVVRGELDWIVMKALEKNRNRRYETANDLALDVQRYLADEPVQACPPSAAYRFRKFARRHRGPVLATTIVLVLLTAGIVGTTIGLIQASEAQRLETQQRRIAERERDEKEKARKEAVAHLQTARQAMERMLFAVSKDGVPFGPRLEGIWRDLLRETLTFYEELHKNHTDDPSLNEDLALAYGRLGQAHHRLGDYDQATQMLRQSIDILETLSNHGVLSSSGRETLIDSYRHLGWVYSEVGRRDERVTAHEQAFRHAEQLVADFPESPRYQDRLADVCTILGVAWKPTRPSDAEALFRRAIALLDKPGRNRHHLGTAQMALGELLTDEGRLAEAEAALRRAVALYLEVVERSPRFWQGWDRSSEARLHLSRVLVATGRTADAEEVLRPAIEVWEKQKADFPLVHRYPDDVIIGYAALIQLLTALGKIDDARSFMQKLAPLEPEGAAACNDLAWLLATCQEPTLRDRARAVQLAKKATTLLPQFARQWRTLGAAHYRAEDHRAAIVALEKSMELRKGGDSFDWFFLAMAHGRLGNKDEAHHWYQRAIQWMKTHQPDNTELRRIQVEAAKTIEIDQDK